MSISLFCSVGGGMIRELFLTGTKGTTKAHVMIRLLDGSTWKVTKLLMSLSKPVTLTV